MNNFKTIEILRDIYNDINSPIIFVGMGLTHKKLARHKHLFDSFWGIVKFETFSINDLKQIFDQLSEVPFTPDTIEFIHKKYNSFRQTVQLVNQLEKVAKDNNWTEITFDKIIF